MNKLKKEGLHQVEEQNSSQEQSSVTPRESDHSNGSANVELIGENEDVICCSFQKMISLKLDIKPHESKIKS